MRTNTTRQMPADKRLPPAARPQSLYRRRKRWRHGAGQFALVVLLLLLGCEGLVVEGAGPTWELAYSFRHQDRGGIGLVSFRPEEPDSFATRTLFQSDRCRQPLKVRAARDGRFRAVTNLDPRGPHLFIVGPDHAVSELTLPAVPDEIQLFDGRAIITCDDDFVVLVDLPNAKILRVIDVSKSPDFQPPANGPEGITITPDERFAIISFQKDSRKGKKLGNRLGIFRLPEFSFVADLALPRDQPDLHVPGDLKEQGPGPELIYVAPQADTLLVTLDLYGAVGLADWSAAQAGRLSRWQRISTAVDSSPGTAFPDRGTGLRIGNRDFYLVCNAGVRGGAMLIDLKRRHPVWQRSTPPGLESPVYVPHIRQAFSVCTGKTKRRLADSGQAAKGIEKSYHPQPGIFAFDFRTRHAIANAPVDRLLPETYGLGIAALDPSGRRLVVATTDRPDRQGAEKLVLLDPENRRVLAEVALTGHVGRLQGK